MICKDKQKNSHFAKDRKRRYTFHVEEYARILQKKDYAHVDAAREKERE